MQKIPTLALCLIIICFAAAYKSHAQSTATANLKRTTLAAFANSKTKDRKVTAELERRQKVLQDIASRYEEVSSYDLTPLLKFPYLWNALRENRSHASAPKGELTVSQSRLVKKAYELLEEETLMSFLDQQINLLTETLELDAAQQEEAQKFLTIDLSNKKSLLSAPIGPQEFRRRLDIISDETEKRILAILYPEQRRMFDRQQMFNRDRLVG